MSWAWPSVGTISAMATAAPIQISKICVRMVMFSVVKSGLLGGGPPMPPAIAGGPGDEIDDQDQGRGEPEILRDRYGGRAELAMAVHDRHRKRPQRRNARKELVDQPAGQNVVAQDHRDRMGIGPEAALLAERRVIARKREEKRRNRQPVEKP